MKKSKSLLALLCALLCLSPTATLFACDKNNEANLPTDIPSIEIESGTDEDLDASSNSVVDSESQTPPEKDETSSNTPAPEPEPVVQTSSYIRCTGDNVNIRSGAGTDFAVLGQAEKGTMYAVIGKTGNWYKTYYRNKVAYIYASYASVFTLEKTQDERVEKVIEEGYKLIGVPYVYGAVRLHDGNGKLLAGFTAQKFDCSSLVQYVFYKGANKLLQVNTRTQFKQGQYVSPSELQRGDCIYFTNEERQYNTGVERIGHVAIYLGNNYILHTASDYARIEKMSTYRWNFYVEARRFLT
ncbi:MAG: C40 family peptidase [Clostridia bacterium]|nr:C40 family peptidase [Clostridia bacterium]